MKVFLVHRFTQQKAASSLLKKIALEEQIVIEPFIMDSSKGDEWKLSARKGIEGCEAVVVFNNAACLQSDNATWEISVAKKLNKPLVFFEADNPNTNGIEKLCAIYNHDLEFNSYFKRKVGGTFRKSDSSGTDKEVIELYKTMVASSEQLIQRRLTMNAFFIAAIGSLLAFAGALIKFGSFDSTLLSFLVIGLLAITGLFLCNSWHNLIDNYGKLNKAKFRVISKLEEKFTSQIFSAEWAALGKGNRPKKYKSFTSTEKNVPLWFASLITTLLILFDIYYVLSYVDVKKDITKDVTNQAGTLICGISVVAEKQQAKISHPALKKKGCPAKPS